MQPIRGAFPAGWAACVVGMLRRRSYRRLIVLLLPAAAAALAAAAWVAPGLADGVLEVLATASGERVLCARMQRGEEFILSYMHSVNRRPVYDTLRAEGDRLVIVRSRYDAFGAGMPEGTTDAGRLALLPDGRLEWTVERAVPEVVVRVGRIAEHTLIIRGREHRLADHAAPGAALTLRARPARVIDYLKGRCIP